MVTRIWRNNHICFRVGPFFNILVAHLFVTIQWLQYLYRGSSLIQNPFIQILIYPNFTHNGSDVIITLHPSITNIIIEWSWQLQWLVKHKCVVLPISDRLNKWQGDRFNKLQGAVCVLKEACMTEAVLSIYIPNTLILCLQPPKNKHASQW